MRSNRLSLQYIVCDGGSTDGTVERVRDICGRDATIISEPDRGMYDALAKGLRRATGDVVAYLNAGDVYFPWAFDVVADVIGSGQASWVTGMKAKMNVAGQVVSVEKPFVYRRSLIRCGLYGRVLPFIQQESTFWARGLSDALELDQLASLRLAGDQYLWAQFARRAELSVVETCLGAFLLHRGQQSEDLAGYRTEMRAISDRPRARDYLKAASDALGWALPRISRRLARSSTVSWSRNADRWL